MKRTELLTLQAEIESDLADLARVVEEIREMVQALPSQEEPSHKDKAALGAYLHSFYNGVENVLKRVAQEIDRSVPTGEGWHRALLRRMAAEVPGVRSAVLRSDTVAALEPYLGFRHFFRHSYTFEIDWEKLKPLVERVTEVSQGFRQDLEAFFADQLRRVEAEEP